MLRTPTVSLARTGLRAASAAQQSVIRRAATTHAISNPTLANIEKRWEGMPLQEQAELWMALRDRMKGPWSELTLNEKKAAYWIAFGPHGPRAGPAPGENSRVFWGVIASIAASLALFGTARLFAGPPPDTMTKEYQEASNEFLKNQKSDPITGISSEGYSGKGMVQSPPKGH
ncbi:Cytochrome c oxidase polypeptide 5, mitochondrial [Colletotrichum truncatum]|uniref:Cytochrome c oxidase polypeptide 5, mitochondrial n=1 Tax=Colletotrichum truncatum TaxID=5467 RepID=A0ACC3Z994_COLTU|nr:Cytochrome c oxidase polypeptide 5, mitochondrial [Colletotrichum truncatum]KAF6793543.1 Cytochrome c oxidase polypeptide 5, mitochondrial [Colletotrichum truncatum]